MGRAARDGGRAGLGGSVAAAAREPAGHGRGAGRRVAGGASAPSPLGPEEIARRGSATRSGGGLAGPFDGRWGVEAARPGRAPAPTRAWAEGQRAGAGARDAGE